VFKVSNFENSLKSYYLKIQDSKYLSTLFYECNVVKWLKNKIFPSRVVIYEFWEKKEYICNIFLLVGKLAVGLKKLHSINIAQFCIHLNLDIKLTITQTNTENVDRFREFTITICDQKAEELLI
jgi:aminoglycoside phosphotransferase